MSFFCFNPAFACDATRRSLLGALAGAAALGGCTGAPPAASGAPAAPPRFDPERRMGPTVWDRGTAGYRFDRLSATAPGSGHRHRLWLAWPRAAAPAGGRPLLCMLDGNAVADTLTAAQFDALSDSAHAPVILAIGPDSDLRFDVTMRAFDYTPPVRADGPTWDDEQRGRRGGGADAFLDFITAQAIPAAAARAPLDGRRLAVWGHSYGGLFVLHALFRRPEVFARHAAADPSLWWQDGFILAEAGRAAPLPAGRESRLLLMQGDSAAPRAAAAPPRPGLDPAQVARMRRQREAVPPDSGRRLVERLQARPGLQAEHLAFPGVDHGAMLAASIPAALALASRPVPAAPGRT